MPDATHDPTWPSELGPITNREPTGVPMARHSDGGLFQWPTVPTAQRAILNRAVKHTPPVSFKTCRSPHQFKLSCLFRVHPDTELRRALNKLGCQRPSVGSKSDGCGTTAPIAVTGKHLTTTFVQSGIRALGFGSMHCPRSPLTQRQFRANDACACSRRSMAWLPGTNRLEIRRSIARGQTSR